MSYNYDSIVSKQEQDALKDMIFKRAMERAEALNETTKNSYTSSFKAEIMDLARESFVSAKNPFSINTQNTSDTEAQNVETNKSTAEEPERIKEARKHAEEIRAQIDYRNKIASENIANSTTREAMNDAREALSKKTSFMGALEFLNSQATISLVNKSGTKFSALA